MLRNIILFLLAGTLLFFILLRIQGAALIQPYAPAGIVSFELASNAKTLEKLLIAYQLDHLIKAVRFNIFIDFFFIPFYAFLFYTLSGKIAVSLKGIVARIGAVIAFMALLAGIFDIGENILMLLASMDIYSNLTAILTCVFASIKFGLLGLNIIFILLLGSYTSIRSFTRF